MDENELQAANARISGWYELFSRGARDWLRHNEKVRDAVREHLPEIIAGADVVGGGARTVRVPVRMLEHYHFRLRRPSERDAPRVVQAWFQGLNPHLEDRSPARLLRDGDLDEVGPLVLAAARAFLVGG